MASRLDMINRLAANAPVVNQQAADQLQAGRQMQLQRAVSQAPVGGNAARGAQSVAGANATNAGQISLQTQQQNVGQIADLGKQAVEQAGVEQRTTQQTRATGQAEQLSRSANSQSLALNRADINSNKRITRDETTSAERVAKLGIDQDNRLLDMSLRQRSELSSLGRDVKSKILDSRLQFERDESGRKFSNDRQLADYALAQARTEQEFSSRMREMKQASDKKIALLENSGRQIMEVVQRGWLVKEQKLDYEHKKYLLELKRKIEEQIAREQARSRNRMMVAQGVGTLAGAAAGGVIGSGAGPAGTAVGVAAGAQAGGAVGTLVGGALG